MIRVQELPTMAQLKRLTKETRSFPIRGLGVVQTAEHYSYNDSVVSFLRLFDPDLIFKNRTDFLRRCNLLEKLIKEEEIAMPEELKSLED